MDCPVCKNVKLVMADRQGIEVDYCPNCRGVWLDRGELDKIIDGAAGVVAASPLQGKPSPYHEQQYQGQGYGGSQPSPGHYVPPQGFHNKKRKGFLGELFDFD